MVRSFLLSGFLSGLCALIMPTVCAETLPGPIPAEVVRVIDGDTVQVRAKIWLNQTIEISVRVAQIDTPEVYRPECSAERKTADQATDAARAFLGREVLLHNIHNGKYAGRVVADVHHRTRGSLSAHLLELGLAVAEDEDDPWCSEAARSASHLP